MSVQFTKKFQKQYKKAPVEITDKFNKRLQIFIDDEFDSLLNNHALTGVYSGYRSINITGDWRAIYRKSGDLAIFEALGTHSQLYR